MNRCHTLFRSAIRADKAYERAIKRAVGRSATRWTITPAQAAIPAVHKAYARMVAFGKARARACEIQRRDTANFLRRGFRDAIPAAAASAAPAAPAQPKLLGRARRRRRR